MEQKVEVRAGETNITRLLMRLPGEARMLFSSQAALARSEMKAKAARAVRYAAVAAAGMFMLAVAAMAAAAAVVIILAIFIPLWVSVIIVTLAIFITGGTCALAGLSKLKRMDWRPERTMETLKENMRWLKGHAS